MVGKEVLGEGLLLIGLEPRKVRLVVRIHPGHEFNIGAICIGQIAVPCLAEVPATPCPLLFSR
ncbi:hypothetical protein SDC9_102520 [bioreactor metagenome]|uniref:Uncharacterized protein n=1 Tax=bioreactor metagenome TaxID=1076179 RepID=A0A645AXY1_9ZZZZ